MQDIENRKYSGVAILLHWIMAILIIGNIAIAKYIEDLPREQKMSWLYQHKAIGTVVLLLIVWRLYWRATHQPPALPDTTRGLAALAAHGGHIALYALMVAVPLTGLIQNLLRGRDLGLWFFTLPSPFAESKDIAKIFGGAHDIFGNLLMLVIAGHILAALYHQFFKRDQLIQRMIP